MTPKEKAKQLVDFYKNIEIEYCYPIESGDGFYDDFYSTMYLDIQTAKQCALIAVDEMIKLNGDAYLNQSIVLDYYRKTNAYLFEVKSEIEKL